MTPEEKEQIEKEDLALPYTENLEKHLQFIRERISELQLAGGIIGKGFELGYWKRHILYPAGNQRDYETDFGSSVSIMRTLSCGTRGIFCPDFHNPTLLHEAMEALKGLVEEDLIQMNRPHA